MITRSQKAVKSIIDKLCINYIGTKFRYQYNEVNNVHIVEVTPQTTFNNPQYSDEEFDIVINFEEKYGETLLFISTNSLTKVINPTYERMIEEPEFSYIEEAKSSKPIFNLLSERSSFFSIVSSGISTPEYLSIASDDLEMELS